MTEGGLIREVKKNSFEEEERKQDEDTDTLFYMSHIEFRLSLLPHKLKKTLFYRGLHRDTSNTKAGRPQKSALFDDAWA